MNQLSDRILARRLLEARESGYSLAIHFRRGTKRYLLLFACFGFALTVFGILQKWHLVYLMLGMFVGCLFRDIGWVRTSCQTFPFSLKVTDWDKVQQLAAGKREPVLRAEYEAHLREADGSMVKALFHCFDDSMIASPSQQCRLVLKFREEELVASAGDFFAALDEVREQLEPRGIVPLVNGASRTNYPSGMARDMGMGMSVYRLQLGKPMGDTKDIVRTFESNAIDQVSTVKEQLEFVEQWRRSFPDKN